MSDKAKKDAVKALQKSKKSAGKAKGLGGKGVLLMVCACIVGVLFMPTTVLLMVGMAPSFVAMFVSGTGRGARASTIAAMNIAGCLPFVFKLWSGENDFAYSLSIVTDSQAVMVMYTAAAFGYMIDWLVTGLVSSYLYQKGVARMKTIQERQAVLVSDWGEDVTGRKSSK
ncbi:MAG: hypothetical protein ACRBDI_10135 [Alphaproteobacteria bacterium]